VCPGKKNACVVVYMMRIGLSKATLAPGLIYILVYYNANSAAPLDMYVVCFEISFSIFDQFLMLELILYLIRGIKSCCLSLVVSVNAHKLC
jgi:hypothetical protein